MDLMTSGKLPASTHITAVHLRITDLQRSLAFYADLLGFHLLRTEGGDAWLGAGDECAALIHLAERADARPRPPRATGLFHVAYRAPDRAGLSRWLYRLLSSETPMQGASDHGVSEALYLADPDGLGVELYCDRPRERWKFRGKYVAMVSEQLDTADLLAQTEGQSWEGVDPQTDVGHVHLCVSSLEAAERFYIDALGMDAMQRDFPGALFIAAGGYHHHIGTNTWRSAGAPPAPADAVGLKSFTLGLPDAAIAGVSSRFEAAGHPVVADHAERVVADDDGIGLRLRASD